MSVPTYDQFIEPILRFLATKPDGAIARDAHEAAAKMLQLTEAQREDLIASGQATTRTDQAGHTIASSVQVFPVVPNAVIGS